jgi:hypothetical protein
MRVAVSLLNSDGELKSLRELLDGDCSSSFEAEHALVSQLQRIDRGVFGGVRRAWLCSPPDGKVFAVCGELHRWLGLQVRYVGFLWKENAPGIMGQYVVGKRSSEGWIMEEYGHL